MSRKRRKRSRVRALAAVEVRMKLQPFAAARLWNSLLHPEAGSPVSKFPVIANSLL